MTAARPRKSFYKRHESFILGGSAVMATLAIWQALWSAGKISPLFMSGPSAIWKRFHDDLLHGNLLSDLAYSGKNFAIGFVLAVVLGVVLGVIVGWYKRVEMLASPFINALYATPRVAMIPLIIIWFGIGIWSKVFIVFITAVFPVLINTIGGIRAIDRDLLRAARAFCASDRQIFTTVAIPGAVPFILTGIRQGVALGLIGVVVGEMFGGSQGIGFMVAYGGQTFATDTLFVGVLIIAFAGIVLTSAAEQLEKRFSRWRPERWMERMTRLGNPDSCAVSDALDKLGLKGAVTGIHRFATERRIAGRVLTVKLDRAEGRSNTRHLCTTAIDSAEPGDIIVVEQRTGIDAASWGGNLAIGAKMRGVAGVIVEGPARDIDDCRKLDFPVFARSHTSRTARGRIVEVATNEPILVGDVEVDAGDYVVADGSGVVFVAQADIARVLETAEGIMTREEAMAQALRDGTPISQVMGANYETMLKK